MVNQQYLDGSGRWGVMEEGRWRAFLEWLDESGLLKDKVRRRLARKFCMSNLAPAFLNLPPISARAVDHHTSLPGQLGAP